MKLADEVDISTTRDIANEMMERTAHCAASVLACADSAELAGELLAALRALADEPHNVGLIAAARVAIAKAEGRS